MLLLTATSTGHSGGPQPPLPGELLTPAELCDNDHCLCRREFVGITTEGRTLHAVVTDLDLDDEQLRDIARDYVADHYADLDVEITDDDVDAAVHDLVWPGQFFAAGTVVQRLAFELGPIDAQQGR